MIPRAALLWGLTACHAPAPRPHESTTSPTDPACLVDQDHDSFGACVDCDETETEVYPGAPDDWYDGHDSDCAGNSDFDQDGDGDNVIGGFPPHDDCDDTDPHMNSLDPDGDGFSACAGDCDPYDAAVAPGAPRVCGNAIDDDCDSAGDCHFLGDVLLPDDRYVLAELHVGGITAVIHDEPVFLPGEWPRQTMWINFQADILRTYKFDTSLRGTFTTADAMASIPIGHTTPTWLADVTGDGVEDMLVQVNPMFAEDYLLMYPGPHVGDYEESDALMLEVPYFGSNGCIGPFDHDGDGVSGLLMGTTDNGADFGVPSDQAFWLMSAPFVGEPTFQVDAVLYPAFYPSAVQGIDRPTDLTGDGIQDVVFKEWDWEEIYVVDGTRLSGTQTIGSVAWTYTDATSPQIVGDVDGNGLEDLGAVFTTDLGDVRFGIMLSPLPETHGRFEDLADIVFYDQLANVNKALGDIDGDGNRDLGGGESLLHYGPFVGQVPLGPQDATLLPGGPTVPVGDVDGDGIDDLVSIHGFQDIYLLRGRAFDEY